MSSLIIDDFKFSLVPSGSVFVGESKGGWIYSSQRPRHEVQCPEFYIMDESMTLKQLSNLLNKNLEHESEIIWNRERLEHVISLLNELLNKEHNDLDSKKKWEVRCPTQGEWLRAEEQNKINIKCKTKEILADSVSSNYRGAMMDGRPRKFTGHGPMKWHIATMEIHPSNKKICALSSAPMDRENRGLIARFVITPVREGAVVMVPKKADLRANIRDELLWTFLLGVVPSFAIPWLRGMGDYVYSGWANLLFGGLCIGFVSGAFWRPKRPTIMFEDGEIIESSE